MHEEALASIPEKCQFPEKNTIFDTLNSPSCNDDKPIIEFSDYLLCENIEKCGDYDNNIDPYSTNGNSADCESMKYEDVGLGFENMIK